MRAQKLERDAEYDGNPVRIAIIDTGIKPDDNYAQDMAGNMYRDFVDKTNTAKQDNVGHGTDTVNLIFRVLKDPEIYVARVFEQTRPNEKTPELVAEASGPLHCAVAS